MILNSTDSLLLVGHGSRDHAGNDEILRFARALRARHPQQRIEVCFIEFADVLLDDGMDTAAQQSKRVIVVPLILGAAGHVKMEIPEHVEQARQRHPDVEFLIARHLGADVLVLEALKKTLREGMQSLDMPDAHNTGIVLLGRGSSDMAANGELAKMTRWLYESTEHPWVELAFTGITYPKLETAVQRLVDSRMRQVIVLPYYLFTGVLIERIDRQVQRLQQQYPTTAFALAPYMGFQTAIMKLLEQRVNEALGQSPNGARMLECDGCKYRSFAEEHGMGHHHHDHDHHQHAHSHTTKTEQTPSNAVTEQLTKAGQLIEHTSFAVVDNEAGEHSDYTPAQWSVVRRIIHASADFEFNGLTAFHHDAVEAGLQAIRRGAAIVADVEMICVGLSQPRLAHFGCQRHHFIADEDVIQQAKNEGTTRAVQAMRKAHRQGLLQNNIIAIGNAPTALIEVIRLIREDGLRPALVVGMPVGFVSAEESKALLAEVSETPWIITHGRKGGSTLVVSTLHALLSLAEAGATA